MKYIFQFLRILLFCFLGELLHSLLPLPILISVFPLLFVPGAAGIMELGPLLAEIWLPVLLSIVLVTALVMAAAGKSAQAVIRWKETRHG